MAATKILLPDYGLAKIMLIPNAVVAVSRSPYTGAEQVYEHQGQFWVAEVEYPRRHRVAAEPLLAALLSLNGRAGTFYLGDPAGATPRGVATGTPLVKGANQTGQSIIIDGFTPNTTGILKAGDYLQIGDYLYKALADCSSDATGTTTVSIWPRLRVAPADNAPVTLTNARGLFRLASNALPWSVEPGPFYGIAFSAREAL